MRPSGIIAAAALVVAALAPWFAGATHVDVTDGNDTAGLLDVKRINASGAVERPRFLVRTHGPWTAARIHDRGFVLVFFDTFGTARFDYYALARSTGDAMEGNLYRDRKRKNDYVVASVPAHKPSEWSLRFRIVMRKMKWPATRPYYRWSVQTLFTSDNCKQVCFDRVPDKDAVIEYRTGQTPTPTPTPTPEPTPPPTPPPTPTPTPTETP